MGMVGGEACQKVHLRSNAKAGGRVGMEVKKG